jgi:aspartyl-tRNA(Asn)/glutamyl-tRNA(Gln) amidotransferase subunit B
MTVSMRAKECVEDYRYLTKLDLHPVALDRAWIEETGARLPELPQARRDRFMTQHSLSLYDANILTNSRSHGILF